MNNTEKLDPSALVAIKLKSIKNLSSLDFLERNDAYFEFIIRYQGDINSIAADVSFEYINLYGGFAVIYISDDNINALVSDPRILYIDVPKRVLYENVGSISSEYNNSCMNFSINYGGYSQNLEGEGVLVAVIDTGVDISHPIFRNMNILEIWDQNKQGVAPYDYRLGSIVNTLTDESGHGTSVASILYRCVPKAEYLIVKIRADKNISYSSSFMLAVDYCIRKSIELSMPLVINISYGNNYGDHNGGAILEEYLDTIATFSKNTIVCGVGNEGNTAKHAELNIDNTAWKKAEIIVNEFQTAFTLQIWKSYLDDIDVYISFPSGEEIGPFNNKGLVYDYIIDRMRIFVVASEFSPYSEFEQVYISVIPLANYIEAGIWTIKIKPKRASNKRIDMWLPVESGISSEIRFLLPTVTTSLTIPSTASNVISVGAYNNETFDIALFSGRGYTTGNNVKPDIVAPGVNISVAIPSNGYTNKSGTSFATPFVAAGAAMLMQWGIVNGNDRFLFGNKVKDLLILGARRLPGYINLPDPAAGFGALCVEDSLR